VSIPLSWKALKAEMPFFLPVFAIEKSDSKYYTGIAMLQKSKPGSPSHLVVIIDVIFYTISQKTNILIQIRNSPKITGQDNINKSEEDIYC